MTYIWESIFPVFSALGSPPTFCIQHMLSGSWLFATWLPWESVRSELNPWCPRPVGSKWTRTTVLDGSTTPNYNQAEDTPALIHHCSVKCWQGQISCQVELLCLQSDVLRVSRCFKSCRFLSVCFERNPSDVLHHSDLLHACATPVPRLRLGFGKSRFRCAEVLALGSHGSMAWFTSIPIRSPLRSGPFSLSLPLAFP